MAGHQSPSSHSLSDHSAILLALLAPQRRIIPSQGSQGSGLDLGCILESPEKPSSARHPGQVLPPRTRCAWPVVPSAESNWKGCLCSRKGGSDFVALSSISLASPNPWDLLEGRSPRWQLGPWKEWGWQGWAVQTPGSARSLSGSQLGYAEVSWGAANGPPPTHPPRLRLPLTAPSLWAGPGRLDLLRLPGWSQDAARFENHHVGSPQRGWVPSGLRHAVVIEIQRPAGERVRSQNLPCI